MLELETLVSLQRLFSTFARRWLARASVMEALLSYDWPGNIRELQNFIERAMILSSSPLLQVPLADLKRPVTKAVGSAPTVFSGGPPGTRQELERSYGFDALQKSNWVGGGPHGAAALLGLSRTTLNY